MWRDALVTVRQQRGCRCGDRLILPRVLRLDHVVLASADAAVTAAGLRATCGLGSLPGAHHEGEGSGNWIVPLLPPQYLEIFYVDDPVAAASSDDSLIRLTAAVGPGGFRLAGWAVSVDDIGSHARRLGLKPQQGTAVAADGSRTRWALLHHPDPELDAILPFFVCYDDPEGLRPLLWKRRLEDVHHDCLPGGISWIECGTDRSLLESWIGPADLPVRHIQGPAGINAVAIDTDRGEVVLRNRAGVLAAGVEAAGG